MTRPKFSFPKSMRREDDQKIVTDKLQKILTPDQMKKWEDLKTENKEKMKDRMKRRSEETEKKE